MPIAANINEKELSNYAKSLTKRSMNVFQTFKYVTKQLISACSGIR